MLLSLSSAQSALNHAVLFHHHGLFSQFDANIQRQYFSAPEDENATSDNTSKAPTIVSSPISSTTPTDHINWLIAPLGDKNLGLAVTSTFYFCTKYVQARWDEERVYSAIGGQDAKIAMLERQARKEHSSQLEHSIIQNIVLMAKKLRKLKDDKKITSDEIVRLLKLQLQDDHGQPIIGATLIDWLGDKKCAMALAGIVDLLDDLQRNEIIRLCDQCHFSRYMNFRYLSGGIVKNKLGQIEIPSHLIIEKPVNNEVFHGNLVHLLDVKQSFEADPKDAQDKLAFDALSAKDQIRYRLWSLSVAQLEAFMLETLKGERRNILHAFEYDPEYILQCKLQSLYCTEILAVFPERSSESFYYTVSRNMKPLIKKIAELITDKSKQAEVLHKLSSDIRYLFFLPLDVQSEKILVSNKKQLWGILNELSQLHCKGETKYVNPTALERIIFEIISNETTALGHIFASSRGAFEVHKNKGIYGKVVKAQESARLKDYRPVEKLITRLREKETAQVRLTAFERYTVAESADGVVDSPSILTTTPICIFNTKSNLERAMMWHKERPSVEYSSATNAPGASSGITDELFWLINPLHDVELGQKITETLSLCVRYLRERQGENLVFSIKKSTVDAEQYLQKKKNNNMHSCLLENNILEGIQWIVSRLETLKSSVRISSEEIYELLTLQLVYENSKSPIKGAKLTNWLGDARCVDVLNRVIHLLNEPDNVVLLEKCNTDHFYKQYVDDKDTVSLCTSNQLGQKAALIQSAETVENGEACANELDVPTNPDFVDNVSLARDNELIKPVKPQKTILTILPSSLDTESTKKPSAISANNSGLLRWLWPSQPSSNGPAQPRQNTHYGL